MEQKAALITTSSRPPLVQWGKTNRFSRRTGGQPARSQPLRVGSVDERLRHLSGEIAWYEEETRKNLGLLLQYRLEIGKRLAWAKTLLPHGKFLSWARQEFGWAPRQVQNHLTLAANSTRVSRLDPKTSLRMALAAIKKSPLKAHEVERISPPSSAFRRITLIGEIQEGELDREGLLAEMARIAATFGATKTTWKVR